IIQREKSVTTQFSGHILAPRRAHLLDSFFNSKWNRQIARRSGLLTKEWQRPMDNPFMKRAIQLSIDSLQSGRGGPFGAVIVRHSKIVAEGANQVTSTNDPTAHAEIVAIRRACYKLGVFELKDCELYTWVVLFA